MEHLLNVLRSASRALVLIPPARDYPEYRGFEHDAQQMRGDWKQLGADMRVALKKEKQSRIAHGK